MESKEGGLFSHDPAIFYDEKSKYYYIYSTDTAPKFREGIGGQIRRSKDLVHFEYIGTALKEVPEEVKELTDTPPERAIDKIILPRFLLPHRICINRIDRGIGCRMHGNPAVDKRSLRVICHRK